MLSFGKHNSRAKALSGHYIVAATVSESHLSFTTVITDIDQVGLRDNLAVSAVSAAQTNAGTNQFCRQLLVQINLRRSNIAVTQTHCVELGYGSAGREVHIQ